MGLSGIHQKKNSTEMWCIFRIADSDVTDQGKKCSCNNKGNVRNREDIESQEKSDQGVGDGDQENIAEDSDGLRQEDMDDSFCSYRSSTTTMDQGELAEQLALVQEMVQEMKNGFSTAMEELAKIQFGDQNLQQQIANDRTQITEEVQALRSEVQSLVGQIKTVTEAQKSLEDKVDSIQNFNLVEQLQQLGLLNDQSSLKPEKAEQYNSSPEKEFTPQMAPMVQPFLGSLQQQQRVVDDSDNQSVTAKATKCLNLTQALHEKCLHLDISVSSDDDDTMANTQIPHFPVHNLKTNLQREKTAQEVVEAERSYCSQLWTLIDSYINLLRQEEIMGTRDLNCIFPPYISHLYEQHCLLLRKMEERMVRWKWNNMIGDIFVKLTESQEGDHLSLYKEYINDFPAIINNLNQWFAQSASFREVMRSTSLASCAVIPLLLAPLQQIPKYSLIIKKILRHTGADHPDRYYLETALSRLNNFLNVMNDELEHGMRLLNMNKSTLSRMRNGGNSLRSRSSGSSGEVNQGSSAQDSGIHSNGEDAIHRHPASPGTARRHVLQVLRERREREALQRQQESHHSKPVTVPPRSHMAYGSHPDLTGHEYSVFNGSVPPEMSTYMPYQSGHKMYSSLSKIQSLSPERTAVKKIKIRRRPESQKIIVSSNYLRPLTPHLPFGSTPSREHYDHNNTSRMKPVKWNIRQRPASSMDVMESPERRDRIIEHWRQQSSLESPRGHPGEGRARNDFHISVQKLLAERDLPDDRVQQDMHAMENENYIDHEIHDGTFRPVNEPVNERLPDNENIDDYGEGTLDNKNSSFDEGLHQAEDYGIFGDDDDNDENYKYEPQTPRRRLLPEPIIQGNLSGNKTNSRILPYVVTDNSQTLNSQSFNQEQIAVSLAHSLSNTQTQVHLAKVENESIASSDKSDSPRKKRENNQSFEELRHKELDLRLKPENLVPLDNDEVFEAKSLSKLETENTQQDEDIDRFNFENKRTFVQAEKPSEDEIIKQASSQNWANIGSENESKTDDETITERQEIVKRRPLSLKVRQQEMGDNSSRTTNIPSPTYSRNSAIEPSQRQTPSSKVRLSQPNLDQMHSSRIPVRPLSPSDGKNNLNGGSKDTKIPVYSPRKKEKGSKTPRDSLLSKSTEEISKMKKKTHFKDSIKNFFGRKRKTSSKYKFKEFASVNDLSEFTQRSPRDENISLALQLQDSWKGDVNRNEPLPSYDIIMALRDLENQPCSAV